MTRENAKFLIFFGSAIACATCLIGGLFLVGELVRRYIGTGTSIAACTVLCYGLFWAIVVMLIGWWRLRRD